MEASLAVKPGSSRLEGWDPEQIPADWLDLLRQIPGYDPLAHAEGCRFSERLAKLAIDFFPECLCHVEGDLAGKPFKLESWQKAIVGNLFGWVRIDGKGRQVRRYRELFLEVPRKNGKALDVDTPIPTPSGWTRMGDLRAGDSVFDERGQVCRVLEAHPVMTGHACYRVGFSDGTSIIADAEHLWTLHDRYRDGKLITLTTREVAETHIVGCRSMRRERRYNLPAVAPLDLPANDLLVPPYALGVWLGDGDSDCARITNSAKDDELLSHVRCAGVSATIQRVDPRADARRVLLGSNGRGKPGSLHSKLRALGLLRNKHIPFDYLRGSAAQRMELLRGLMDTDGYASKAGQCEFVTVRENLYHDVLELIRSLGLKPTSTIDRASVNGKDCGPRYRIQFWAWRDCPVFKLKRKAERLKPRPLTATRSTTRQVVSVEPVTSVPVRCIRVDSPSSLFLAGRGMAPTHNTPLVAGIGLYVLFCDDEKGQQGYVAAGEREQAGMLFRHCKGMVEHEPMMAEACTVYGGTAQAGQSRSIVKHDGSFLRVIAADGDTQHGGNSHLVIVDEVHVQPNRDLIDVLKTSMASENRKQPLFAGITTAGYDRTSICYEMYQRACAVRDNGGDPLRPGFDPTFLPVIYEALPDDDWKSEETWKKANPNLGVSVSLEYLRRTCQTAIEVPGLENTFRQLHLNQWTEQANRWLPMSAWERCGIEKIPDLTGCRCYGGLDLASTSDTTALVLVFERDGGGYWVLPRVWVPRAAVDSRQRKQSAPYSLWESAGVLTVTEGDWCDYTVVERDILELRDKYDIGQIGYDRKEASMLAQRLLDAGVDMKELPQTVQHYNEPCKLLESLVNDGKLGHGGHPVLTWMAGNVALSRKYMQNNLRLPDKASSGDKIDGIAALLMAISIAISHPSGSGSIYDKPGNLFV